MSTDSLRDSAVLSVFEDDGASFEPQTTAAVAEALGRPREQVTDVLTTLSERGQLDSKPVGESRIWWPTQPLDGRTADGKLEPEQRRRLDLFENVQDIANVGAWEYDIEADEGWGTDEVLRIHGLESGAHVSPEESLEFYHPDDQERIREAFERAIKYQEPYDLELRFIDADGNRRWIRSRGQAQYEDGEAVRVHGTIQDITERKEHERQLRQEQQRYTTLFEALPNPVLRARIEDGEPVVETVNPAFEDTFGYDAETIRDEPLQDDILSDDQADTVHQLNQQVLTGDDVQREVQRETTDGIRTFRLNVSTRNTETEAVEGYAVYTDITERKEREQERERQYEAIFNQTYQFIGLMEPDGTLLEANEAALEFGGLDDEDVIGKPFWNAYWWQIDDEAQRELRDAVERAANGEFVRYDVEVQGEEENIMIDFSIRPVTDEDGEVTYLIPEGRNITELKTLQEQKQKLERQNKLFAKSQKLANVGAWEYNPQEQEGHFSDMVYEIYGVGPDYDFAPEKDLQEFYHPDDRDTARTAIEEALQSGKEYDLEVRITAADGTDKWIRTRGTPQVEDGTVQYVRGTIQEITERKEREQELQELKTQYKTLVENYPDGAVFLIDRNLKYVRAGGEELNKVGLSPDDVEGRKPHALFPEEIADEICHYYEEALEGNANTFEQEYGGEQYRIQTVPVRTDDEIDHLMAVSKNITEQKERERELERKTRAIEEAPVGIAITDPSQDDNQMIYVNQRFEELTGYSREEAIGRNCRFLQGDETRADPVAKIRQGIDDDEPVSADLRNYRKDGTEFWNHLEVAPVEDESGAVSNYVGFQQDVTDRKERERALEKRERVLRELNTATREFHPPKSATAIGEFLVKFVETAFEFEYVSIKRFDEQEGILQPAVRSSDHEGSGVLGPVEPGSNPIWEVYRQGDSQLLDAEALEEYDGLDALTNQMLAVPIGEFGVLVTFTTGDSEFDDVDTDLIEVVATNAESAFQRLRSDSVRTELADQLSVRQTRVDELQSVIDAIQAIQRNLASSESQDALETGVCEELLETDAVDFVWVGRPRSGDTDLRPTAWAGNGSDYLDAVETGTPDELVPAQRAAADRESYSQQNIPSLVVEEAWAKDALSAGFRSVVSVPLVYDDVLYGVLTAYSRDEDAFDEMYEHLFTDVASLLVNYSRLLEHRFDASQQEYTELEFELSDPTYPLQRLAANTESRIRFDTVVENMTDEIRVLVTVLDGDPERVLDATSSVTSIDDAAWFGDHENDQLSLTVQKPFLASVVGKHRGKLVHSVSDESETRFRVHLPNTASRRPLLDSLSSRYREIEPVAQRQTNPSRVPGTQQVASILTDRQYEILNAAYHGGYYETPRQVTGEGLADSFDISSPAIYNHLQSAHRTLLETVMQQGPDISDESDGLNS